ncbi:PspC domain-containing protein [Limosilactobacillus antri]|uniref:PspC domain protein n=1 Tax=Limosilactobacillus antri DSM 16041 TaxID=525309 RepID=C8P5R9_9LACO|nr:PspC domain-containing protein [Limosilactobacillus antri]EEW54164.1 PspC domain protein [Limosilactobacillus antri DSM 16041]KRK59747.1 PspC domain protein [Limosilactobacillus antri DSM 16041]
MQKKLTKSKNKVFLGVCGGIADYLGVDQTMIRLIAVVLIACTGFFPLTIIYLVAAVIMPDYQEPAKKADTVDGEFKEK